MSLGGAAGLVPPCRRADGLSQSHVKGEGVKNLDMSVAGNILTIKIDLSKDCGPSKSGKTTLIATTEGNIDVQEGRPEKIGLNVYRPK